MIFPPAVGIYNSYCYLSSATSDVPDCLPSCSPIGQVDSHTYSKDKVILNIYKCDHNNKLFVSVDDKKCNAAKDLQ